MNLCQRAHVRRRPIATAAFLCVLLTSGGPAAGQVIINEIMYHPYHGQAPEDQGLEYIELFNAGNAPANLSGWRFSDGVDFVFPEVVLAAGGYLVVAADANAFAATYPGVADVVGGWTGWLSNSGEWIELTDGSSVVVDRVRYADEGDWSWRELGPADHGHRGWTWSDLHDGGGRSLELVNPALPHEHGQNWAASETEGGSPGWVNSAASADAAPLVLEVSQFPPLPAPGAAITVSARVLDEAPTALTVRLHYRADVSAAGNWTASAHEDPNGYQVVMMAPDGPGGDGVYSGQIPAQGDGTIVEFFVEAQDSAGHVRTWPAPSLVDGTPEQINNALLIVDGGLGPDWTPGSQPVQYLIMLERERDELAYIGSHGGDGPSDAEMNGTFINVDGTGVAVHYVVGIRNRGGTSRVAGSYRNNYRVDFPHDDPYEGITALNINNRFGYLQVLGSAVWQMADLPAPTATAVELRINGRDLALNNDKMYGSYVAVEAVDSDFARNHFPDDSEGNAYKCADDQANLSYQGTNPDRYRRWYQKQTNVAADDYSDLIALADALNNTPAEGYVEAISAVIDLRQWLRYLAVDALAGNFEGGLTTPKGDDYVLYAGVVDPRFRLIPHDLDTLFGQGDHAPDPGRDIHVYAGLDGLHELLTDPEVVAMYHEQCVELIGTVFAPEQFDPLADQMLGGWVPQPMIGSIKGFVRQRNAAVLAQIPQEITAASDLPTVAGYAYSTDGVALLSGTANAVDTRAVTAAGQPAAWSQTEGTWQSAFGGLPPGVNRIVVQACDGAGQELERGSIDVWYDTGFISDYPQAPAPGPDPNALAEDTTWTAEEGPYRITGELVVPAGKSLTILPGTSVFFEPDARMVVRGLLVAEGTDAAPIRFTRTPGAAGTWDGLQFIGSTEDNHIAHAVIEYGRTNDGMVGVEKSRLRLEHVTLDHTDRRRIRTIDSSLVVRGCIFTDIFGPDDPPTTDNFSEHIWGSGVPDGGQFVIENNVFGTIKGHNDAIDFDGPSRPRSIPQILNNRFLGGGDDALDLETDAHIEGNVFTNFIKDQYNTSPRESNVISAGRGRHYVVVRNMFYNVGHVAQVKDRAFMTFVNNTVVDTRAAAFFFEIPGLSTPPGRGVYVDSCIFHGVATPVADFRVDDPQWGTTEMTFNRSILPAAWHDLGVGNIDADPLFVDGASDFHLKPTSSAVGAGAGALDMGAYVPAGASVAGPPHGITWRTSASLAVRGPGVTDYVYSLGGPNGLWSEERPIGVPIELAGLEDGGSYQVWTLGKNSAGTWQPIPNASRAWIVDTSYTRLVINEILADDGGAGPDRVELYYDGRGPLDLAGMSLTDDPNRPRRFVFAPRTVMQPGDYLVLQADADAGAPGVHLGFALNDQGESVSLFDGQGTLVDYVEYGLQLPGLSVGRIGADEHWALTVPTLGQANVGYPVGDPAAVKINEWLAAHEVLYDDDFIELFNPQASPVDLGGCFLTDNPVGQPHKSRFAPLTFVPAQGFLVLTADGRPRRSGHADLKLSADGELLSLRDPQGGRIDQIIYTPQTIDVSQGRAPDGSSTLEFFMPPTPGAANPFTAPIIETRSLVALDSIWSYEQSGAALLDSWFERSYDDASWPTGAGALYVENAGLPGPKGTPLTLGATTYYFRTHFTLDADPGSVTQLELTTLIDDGAVIRLNGREVLRLGVPAGDIDYDTYANRTVGNAGLEGPFAIPADALLEGDNVITAEVHQHSATSSDIVFAVQLDATLRVSRISQLATR